MSGESSGPKFEGFKRVGIHVVWATIRTWGERATTLIVFIVLARLIAPSEIGFIALIASVIAIAQVVAEGALSEWLVKQPSTSHAEENAIFLGQLFSGIVAAVCIAVGTYIYTLHSAHRDHALEVAALLALPIPLNCMTRVPEALLRRNLQFDALAMRSLSAGLISGAVGIGLALSGFGIWALIWKPVVEGVTRLLLAAALVKWMPGLHADWSALRRAYKLALGVLGAWTFETIAQRADSIIVGALLGPTALGFYSVAIRIQQLLMEMFGGVVWQVAFPHFAKVSSNAAATRRLHEQFLIAGACLLMPLLAAVCAASPSIIPGLFGRQWTGSVLIFQLLIAVPFIQSLTNINSAILLANDRPRDVALINGLSTLTVLCLTSIGALVGGILGAAFGSSMRALPGPAYGTIRALSVTGVEGRQFFGYLARGLVCSAAAFGATSVVHHFADEMFVIVRAAVAGGIGVVAGVVVGLLLFDELKVLVTRPIKTVLRVR